MNKGYVDLHSHSLMSDGMYSREELIEMARDCGIKYLAISDHNYFEDLSELRSKYNDMILINAAEISCLYYDSHNHKHEIHIVALGFDEKNKEFQELLKNNQMDREEYINLILEALKRCDIDIGTYDDLLKKATRPNNMGRSLIAKEMVRLGYCKDVDEAFDEYIGGFGKKKAFVKNPTQYASIEQVVDTIIKASGIPVLAHLYYYRMDDFENNKLLEYFSNITKGHGAMEVNYAAYSSELRDILRQKAYEYGLMISSGSDYHGHKQSDSLMNHFEYNDVEELLERVVK